MRYAQGPGSPARLPTHQHSPRSWSRRDSQGRHGSQHEPGAMEPSKIQIPGPFPEVPTTKWGQGVTCAFNTRQLILLFSQGWESVLGRGEQFWQFLSPQLPLSYSFSEHTLRASLCQVLRSPPGAKALYVILRLLSSGGDRQGEAKPTANISFVFIEDELNREK